MNVKASGSKTVHYSRHGESPRCNVRTNGKRFRETSEEVTCKKCAGYVEQFSGQPTTEAPEQSDEHKMAMAILNNLDSLR